MPAEIDDVKRHAGRPTFTLKFPEYGQLKAIHFSNYEWSQNLLLLSFVNKIVIISVNIQDELEYEKLAELSHNTQYNFLTFSPETTTFLPVHIEFCAAGKQNVLHVFKSDASNNYNCIELVGHTDYVNDIGYDYDNKYIASASDDHTVRLWNMKEYSQVGIIYLTSPGMSLCWHRDENSKLLVAEKIGIIRFYNAETQKPIMSINYSRPLSSAHWFHGDSEVIGSLQMGELLLWDLRRTGCPTLSHGVFTESGGQLQFSPSSELIALVNRIENVLQVIQIKNKQQALYAKVNVPCNLTWHFRLPYVCIGDDDKVLFWKINVK